MNQLSEKELTGLKELLNEEELLVKKFQMLAQHSQDTATKAKFTEIAGKHQEHFKSLYAQLR